MNVRVQLFALARQLAGRESVEMSLPAGATIGQLRRELTIQVPELGPLARQLMFAVNADYAGDEAEIPPQADVAAIPPVSGG